MKIAGIDRSSITSSRDNRCNHGPCSYSPKQGKGKARGQRWAQIRFADRIVRELSTKSPAPIGDEWGFECACEIPKEAQKNASAARGIAAKRVMVGSARFVSIRTPLKSVLGVASRRQT